MFGLLLDVLLKLNVGVGVGCEGLFLVGFVCGVLVVGLVVLKMLVFGVDEVLVNMLLVLVVGLVLNREDVLGFEEVLFKVVLKVGVGLEVFVVGFVLNRVEFCDRGVVDVLDGLLRVLKRLDVGLGVLVGFGVFVEVG